ncbi:MAG: trypsin-like peptidase domain-containing protein [Deltaproteobacteria bacterium]|nr:trypsin-like peptidase domain-containing protein [Deltaproteobacteria bacterium]MBW2415127.1 trypsin-like peptidase domain-containing protein [Deltaproteobacteria bacterium]
MHAFYLAARLAAPRAAALLPLAVALIPAAAPADERRTPVVKAVERIAPATVNITTTQKAHRSVNPFFRRGRFFDEFFGRFADPRPRTTQSLGTGVLIDERGHVLTNEHVLAGATEIRVTLADGREFEAELIGADPETDLAVVQVRADETLPVASLGRSDDLMIGETVIAIGNPFGLHHTVTTGVLSAVNRSVRSEDSEYHGFLQTDASINPGNSGGPLLNIHGDVIGINTAIFREAEGIGFAIPIDRARVIAGELIEHGEVSPVWLGLRVQRLTPGLRSALDVKGRQGALVSHVFDGSPAKRAGLARGDVVIEFAGTDVIEPRTYFEILRGIPAGEEAAIRVERERKPFSFRVRSEVFPEDRAEELAEVLLGLAVREQASVRGLVVSRVAPRGSAARIGIRPGDVILKVDRVDVTDRPGFQKAVSKLRGRRQVLLLVQRGNRGYHVTLPIS